MSEFQYYEFIALDKPLTQAQLREIREISSRAELTPTSFVNTYDFGSFKGDPHKFLESYYDAMLYYANWGTRRFMVKVPADALDVKEAKLYCGDGESGVEMTSTKSGVIFDFVSNTDEPEDWEEMEQHLAPLVPVREALEAGDLRPLYLGWLAAVSARECTDTDVEPPVPPGMKKLSAPLKALAHFLRIGDELLSVAGKDSGKAEDQWEGVETWIAQLPKDRKDELLRKVVTAEAGVVASELRREFNKGRKKPAKKSKGGGRTVGQLLAEAGMD